MSVFLFDRPEPSVAWPGARRYRDIGARSDGQSCWIDVEHADQIRAEIWYEEVAVERVDDDLMRMWCCLSCCVGTWLELCEVERLTEGELCGTC